MKYKVGDVVRVKGIEATLGIEIFAERMEPLCGKPAMVTIAERGIYRLRPMSAEDIDLDWNWHFTDDMLEEV